MLGAVKTQGVILGDAKNHADMGIFTEFSLREADIVV